jgi:hypothetical protein
LRDAPVKRLSERLDNMSSFYAENQSQNIEVWRLANSIARMEATYQSGLMTLQRLRSGGRQEVVVKHLQMTEVRDGGQAIVAGVAGASA